MTASPVKLTISTALTVCLLSWATATAKQPRPTPPQPTTPGVQSGSYESGPGIVDVSRQVDYLRDNLAAVSGKNKAWWWTWVSLYSVGVLAQAIPGFMAGKIYPTDPAVARDFRVNMLTGAVVTLIGLVALAFSYPTAISAPAKIQAIRDGTPEGERKALNKALALTHKSIKEAGFNTSWVMHLGNFVLNAATGLIMWLGFDLTLADGLIAAGIGFAGGEAQILTYYLTRPDKLKKGLDEYRNTFGLAHSLHRPKTPRWSFTPFPGGMGLMVRF